MIRVGTYNILDGAADGRADGQVAMLADAGLDLLALSECVGPGWAPGGGIRRDWENRLGMWSRGRLEPGDGDGAGRHSLIFGRHDRIRPGTYKPVTTRPPHWRSSGLLEITADGYPHTITILAVHGDAFCPETRLAEARLAARCFLTAPGPAITLGDWNSVHGRPAGRRWEHLPPGDPEPDWESLDEARLTCHWLLDGAGNPATDDQDRMICDRRPSHLLTAAGFRDAIADVIRDPAARPATGGWGPGDAPRRIDRIYLRYLTAAGSQTLDTPQAAALSDHRAVVAEVGLSAPAGTR